MNKKVITIGCLSLAILMGGTVFTSCSNDDEPAVVYPVEKDLAGNYLGNLKVNAGGETDYPNSKVTVSKGSADNTISLGIKDFSFDSINIGDINLENLSLTQTGEGNYSFKGTPSVQVMGVSTPVTTSGTISSNKLTVNLNITFGSQTITVNFDGNKLTGSESSEAKILTFTFDQSNADNSVVLIQPEIKDNTITFSVDENATDEQLKKLVPTITVSDGAVVTPANGVAQDFTQPVTYTVTAADGTQVKYTVTTNKNVSATSYDFEEWEIPEGAMYDDVYQPKGWATCNDAVALIKNMGSYMTPPTSYESEYPVRQTDDKASGKSAMLIQSVDTKGGNHSLFGITINIPKVTAGTAFLGSFNAMAAIGEGGPLSTTSFGIIYDKKPIEVTGFYKYTPGKEFYDENGKLVSGQKDECAITAVLYEVSKDDETLDGSNIYNSDKIVAQATFNNGGQDTYAPFTLKLAYIKEYDKSKKYKFAVIFSSSKDGAAYKAAVGSTLYIDNVKIINE